MDIPRLDDHAIFEKICESITMIWYFLFNTAQVGLLLVFFVAGSTMSKMGSICSSTWDKGMEMTGRKRIIMDNSGTKPYMIRYYLLFKDRCCQDNCFNIFIHKIIRSDEDDLHDHPWGYFTFILSGGYWETIGDVGFDSENNEITKMTTIRHWRKRFFMQKVSDTHIHRLELEKDENTGYENPCWTLFIPFKRTREWGFYTTDTNGFKWTCGEEYNKKKFNVDDENDENDDNDENYDNDENNDNDENYDNYENYDNDENDEKDENDSSINEIENNKKEN